MGLIGKICRLPRCATLWKNSLDLVSKSELLEIAHIASVWIVQQGGQHGATKAEVTVFMVYHSRSAKHCRKALLALSTTILTLTEICGSQTMNSTNLEARH